ncbi:MAG: LysR family transcriptional regulator [Sandaracinaceae bacterium]
MARWDDVRLFLSSARARSFTAAAVEEGIEQSTMSRRIAGLESRLGVRLFDRAPRGLALTPAGERLFQRAERVEAEMQGLEDEASGEETRVSGLVRLALTETVAVHVVVPHVLPLLRDRYPELEVTLLTSYRNADLVQRDADLALRFQRPDRSDLVHRRIARLETAVLANRAYAERRRPDELDWIGLGMPGVDAPESRWVAAHVGRPPRFSTSGYLTQVEMVRVGLGVAVLTRSWMQIDPDLIALDLGLPKTPPIDLHLVAHAARRKIPRIAAVWDVLQEVVGEL